MTIIDETVLEVVVELNPVFARRLYITYLIASIERPNVPRLVEHTGWPRRTIQDVLKALPGLGVTLSFIQDGRRHNDGYYQLLDWGALDEEWVIENTEKIYSHLN